MRPDRAFSPLSRRTVARPDEKAQEARSSGASTRGDVTSGEAKERFSRAPARAPGSPTRTDTDQRIQSTRQPPLPSDAPSLSSRPASLLSLDANRSSPARCGDTMYEIPWSATRSLREASGALPSGRLRKHRAPRLPGGKPASQPSTTYLFVLRYNVRVRHGVGRVQHHSPPGWGGAAARCRDSPMEPRGSWGPRRSPREFPPGPSLTFRGAMAASHASLPTR